MTALPKLDALNTREQSLLDSILDDFYYNEHFCDNCPAMQYEADTGAWFCPCGDDPEDSNCRRSYEWACLKEEAENFIQNIRGCWERDY